MILKCLMGGNLGFTSVSSQLFLVICLIKR